MSTPVRVEPLLPASTHIGAVRLQVAELQRSITYYTTVVGLRVIAHADDSASLGPHDDATVLVFLHEKKGIQPVPPRGAFGLFHFAMLMPDRAALGRFAAHIADAGVRIGMADHLVSEALYLTDPDGLGIEVYADRPRDQWQYHGAELAMATEPLDVQGVIAAGNRRPWTGAPAGTTMGHVHLHVGGLDQAAAFYHRALGFDKTVWSYPGALFMSAGGYHHHLGTNTWSPGPSATDAQARLLEWELIVPRTDDAATIGHRLRASGYDARETNDGWIATDPWGTRVHIKPETEQTEGTASHGGTKVTKHERNAFGQDCSVRSHSLSVAPCDAVPSVLAVAGRHTSFRCHSWR